MPVNSQNYNHQADDHIVKIKLKDKAENTECVFLSLFKNSNCFPFYAFFPQLTGRVIRPVRVWAVQRVLNLSHLPRHTQTARNTDGKRAQASQSQMAYPQAMKV